MYTASPPPPVPPPKPSSHDTSRLGTPMASGSPQPPPPAPAGSSDASGLIPAHPGSAQQPIPDPGETWLPKFFEDKSKQDLAMILSSPELLKALTHSPTTIHPSLAATDQTLVAALRDNMGLAEHLLQLESRLAHQRDAAQAQLLSAHALERQWRQKQSEMDAALAPFGPSSLYQDLRQDLQEQEMVCQAMEESFVDGDGGSLATEREALEWVRKYRDAKKLFYVRQERKERWNERRVGGWR